MIRKTLIIALPLALAACGQTATPNDPVAAATATPGGANPRLESASIIVDANGVGAKGAPLRFGTAREDVDAALEKAFGSPPETSRNEECGAGPMDFSKFGPLQVGYQEGKLAGWFLGKGAGVVTSDGIAPGATTLESLKLERQVKQLDTTLDGEFQYVTADYGTITGFAEPDGTITGLAAGVTCFFR
jgi:hypothetical protein